MSKSIVVIDTPETCSDCPLCIFTADEKKYIGYCNTSDEDYYCKVLERFMEYDNVDGGLDILGKPANCPLADIEIPDNATNGDVIRILFGNYIAYAMERNAINNGENPDWWNSPYKVKEGD